MAGGLLYWIKVLGVAGVVISREGGGGDGRDLPVMNRGVGEVVGAVISRGGGGGDAGAYYKVVLPRSQPLTGYNQNR